MSFWKCKDVLEQKSASGIKAYGVPPSSLEEYIKAVNIPDDTFFAPDDDILYFNESYMNNDFQIMLRELDLFISQQEIVYAIPQLTSGRDCGRNGLSNK